jgi:hypothetical protein
VHLRGMVPFAQSVRAQSNAHALVFFDWTGGGVEGVVSGKLFEYLGSRRPIVFIGGDANSEAARIAERCRAGVRLGNAEEIARWLEATDAGTLAGWQPDAAAVASFSRIRQAERLLGRISAELARSR